MASANHLLPTAYILAGGQSTRYAARSAVTTDKARAVIAGTPMILHLYRELARTCSEVRVVADKDDKYRDLHLANLVDRRPDQGPLGGLHTACLDCPTEWLLLCACDWVRLETDWVTYLCDARHSRDEAVVIRQTIRGRERWQPLFALYHRDVAEAAAQRLDNGGGSMQDFIRTIRARAVAPPHGWARARNVNTPEDLKGVLPDSPV